MVQSFFFELPVNYSHNTKYLLTENDRSVISCKQTSWRYQTQMLNIPAHNRTDFNAAKSTCKPGGVLLPVGNGSDNPNVALSKVKSQIPGVGLLLTAMLSISFD